ncbi:hypothetical protein [Tropicibacter oceani]|uniref:Uncharacterized protein n=1 Tax=Tropicibacter oceani TaxID=3058420 RepID=A0ABY8QLU8_9RHOB|nr:hypothetical protein [Tropicibacter oceani]WGW05587.1 hypothetical protein QF118_08575 [Tropicibacter oceani]
MEFHFDKGFREWLSHQTQEVVVAILTRTALREWPSSIGTRFSGLSSISEPAPVPFGLISGWAMLVAGVAAVQPEPQIRAAAQAAGAALARVASAAPSGRVRAVQAASKAIAGAGASTASDASAIATAVPAPAILSLSISDETNATWHAAHSDSEFEVAEMVRQPLWHDQGWPKGMAPDAFGNCLLDTDPHFDFFRRWYDGMVTGQPLDWELQRRVALIDPKVWESGDAEAVAREIARVEAEWLADQLPQADRLEFDEAQGVFVSQPEPFNAEKLVETTLKQVEFAIQVATTSNCGVNASSTACLYIDYTLEHCREDANAIEQNLEIARCDLVQGVEDGSYQEDGKLTALVQVLDRAVTDLRAHHPEVAKAWEARIKHRLRVAEADQKQMIVEKATELIAISDKKLGRELELDATTIAHGSGEVQGGAIRRFFGRVAQMRIIVRSADVIKRIDASSGYKGTRIVQTLQSLIELITGAF